MPDPRTSDPSADLGPADRGQAAHPGLGSHLSVTLDTPAPEVAVLGVRGEIDSLTTPEVEAGIERLLAAPAAHVVVDLSEVTFLASSGLAALIRSAQLAAAQERRLRLVVATRAVRRPLQLTGADELFDIHEELAAATSSGPV